jgi:hypothetical protein
MWLQIETFWALKLNPQSKQEPHLLPYRDQLWKGNTSPDDTYPETMDNLGNCDSIIPAYVVRPRGALALSYTTGQFTDSIPRFSAFFTKLKLLLECCIVPFKLLPQLYTLYITHTHIHQHCIHPIADFSQCLRQQQRYLSLPHHRFES